MFVSKDVAHNLCWKIQTGQGPEVKLLSMEGSSIRTTGSKVSVVSAHTQYSQLCKDPTSFSAATGIDGQVLPSDSTKLCQVTSGADRAAQDNIFVF